MGFYLGLQMRQPIEVQGIILSIFSRQHSTVEILQLLIYFSFKTFTANTFYSFSSFWYFFLSLFWSNSTINTIHHCPANYKIRWSVPGRIFPTAQNPTRAKAAVCGWCRVTDFVQLSCRRFLRTSPLPTRHSPPTDQNSSVPDFVFGESWENSDNDGQTYNLAHSPLPSN